MLYKSVHQPIDGDFLSDLEADIFIIDLQIAVFLALQQGKKIVVKRINEDGKESTIDVKSAAILARRKTKKLKILMV